MKIDLNKSLWDKINLTTIFELTVLLFVNLIFINPFGVAATIAYIHRVRVCRTTYKLLLKSIKKNDIDGIKKYSTRMKHYYKELTVLEIQVFLNMSIFLFEEDFETKSDFVENDFSSFTYISKEQSVLGIFIE